MIVLIWFLNLGISFFNAWGCGKTWNETKFNGGFPHFLNWCGAIMSASGFSWCYLIVEMFLGANIPVEHKVNGVVVNAPYLSDAAVNAMGSLGYLVLAPPIIGTGIVITLHSWGVFWRRRSFSSGAVAGWNTFATVDNVYNAVSYMPKAYSNVGGFFFGGSSSGSSSDSKDSLKLVVLVLVVLAVIGGILTTYFIIKQVAKSTANSRWMQYGALRS